MKGAYKVCAVGRTKNGFAYLKYRGVEGLFVISSINSQPAHIVEAFRQLAERILTQVKYAQQVMGCSTLIAAKAIAAEEQELKI